MPVTRGDVVDLLYQAPVDPGAWQAAWQAAADWLQATSGLLFLGHPNSNVTDPRGLVGWPEDALSVYRQHFWRVDPYIAFARQRGLSPEPFTTEDAIDRASFLRSEIWNDFGLRYLPAYDALCAAIRVEGPQGALMALHRPTGAPLFDDADRRGMASLLPHIRRAAQLEQHLATVRGEAALHHAALEASEVALLVVDAAGCVQFATDAARRTMARSGLAMGTRAAGLVARDRADDARLHALIADAARGGAGGVTLVTGPTPPPLSVLVCRLPTRLDANTVAGRVAVMLRPAQGASQRATARMAALFGLTPAEAEVLRMLLAGMAVPSVARARDVSVLTVRAQVRGMLAKCGVAGLRELLRMASGLG